MGDAPANGHPGAPHPGEAGRRGRPLVATVVAGPAAARSSAILLSTDPYTNTFSALAVSGGGVRAGTEAAQGRAAATLHRASPPAAF